MILDLSEYNHREDLKQHLEFIDFYKKILLENNIFRAAVIVGSFAKGKPDRVSDIDLVVIVDDKNGKKSFDIIDSKKCFQEVYSYKGEDSGKFYFKKMIFENFVSAEIHICEKSSEFRLKRPYITLFDHDNFLNSITENGEAPKHEDFPALSTGGDEMGWALLDLLKWSIRGNKKLTKLHLLKIADELRK